MAIDEQVLDAARRFADDYLAANAATWETQRSMPREMFQIAAQADLCGLLVPVDQGGRGISFETLIGVVEVLAYADFAAAFALVVHNNHARAIATSGSPQQVERWLPDMLSGSCVGAFLLTEPAGGSDAAAISTSLLATDTGWRLNGEKAWVTNAAHADLLNVFAQTDPDLGARGIVSVQVAADSPGVEQLPVAEMLGCHAMGAGGFRFNDVSVAEDQILVPAGVGFAAAMSGIDIARAVVASMCCGTLQSSIDVVMPRLLERQAFGAPLVRQQGLAWRIGDVATHLAAGRLLARDAAARIDAGEPAALAAAQAKKFVTEVTLDGVAVCMQAMGADGLKHQYPLARHLAAAKVAQYIDGTTEIQNLVISRALQRQYQTAT